MPVLEELQRDERHGLVYVHVEEPRLPEPGPRLEEVVKTPWLREALRARGIERLYRFQAEAVETARRGKNVFIVAGTGTGKTEAFLIPMLEEAEGRSGEVTGLIVYPTKALARDQLDRINFYSSRVFGLRASAYDGDTPEEERRRIFEYPPAVLVTNPDMIHYSLRRSSRFKDLVSTARFIVLDDAHVYGGVFGAHVHMIVRRLRRFLRENPVFIAASATIGNPREFGEKLFSSPVEVVEAGPTRRARVYHVLLSPKSRGKRAEILSLLKILSKEGLRTVVFADSHRAVELIGIEAKRHGLRVEVHRAGLLPEERRRIEEKLRRGDLDAVVATPTLELGIDIGSLDAVVMYGLPPTYSKYLQRAGRVGRRGGEAYVITVLGNDPISAYYERHPREYFSQPPDPVYLDAGNEEVLKVHLVAMAQDAPYTPSILGDAELRVLSTLESEGLVRVRGGRVHPTRKGLSFLKERENIRGVGEMIEIRVAGGRRIGFREAPQAIKELFPGAIYLHGGRVYLSLGIKGRRALVKPLPRSAPPVTTKPLYYTVPEDEKPIDARVVYGVPVEYMELKITDVVYGYVVKSFPGGETLGQHLLDEELKYSFRTKGILLHFAPRPHWSETGNAEAFHAVEHALISAGQMVTGAAPTDMGGISFPSGHIYIYDAFPGGSGVTKLLFQRLEEAIRRAFDIVSRCTCQDGCPRCIYSPYCGNNNQLLSRRKSAAVLGDMLSLRLHGAKTLRAGKPIV